MVGRIGLACPKIFYIGAETFISSIAQPGEGKEVLLRGRVKRKLSDFHKDAPYYAISHADQEYMNFRS